MSIFRTMAAGLGISLDARASVPEPAAIVSPWADQSHLERVELAGLLGDVSMVQLSRARAMRVATIEAGRNRLATGIGALPLVELDSNGKRKPKTRPFLQQPEGGDITRSNTITWTVDHLLFYPWAHWLVTERDALDYPTRVRFVSHAEETTDANGRLIAVGNTPVDPRDVIRFDSIGSGLLVNAADTVRRAIVLAESASRAEQNPVPGVNLHNTGEELTATEINELLDSWEKQRRRRGVAYTSRALEISTLDAPVENLLLDGRKAIDVELVRHLGIPAWAVEVAIDGAALNYTNRASRNWELIDLGLKPYMTVIADRLSLEDVTPHGTAVRFDTSDLVTPTEAEQVTTFAAAIAAGFMTPEEAADRLGYGK